MSAPTEGGLRERVRHGAFWSTLNVIATRTGSFAIGVLIARLLQPDDFGIFAVALVIHAIVINVSEMGVSMALIRDDGPTSERAAPTVATIALVSSTVLAVFMASTAGILASLLGSPSATGTIQVMALTLPLAGIAAVPSAFLRREFLMDRMFFADLANLIASTVIVVVLALAGFGPLALAWSFVAGQVLTTTMIVLFARPIRWPGWDGTEARRLLKFGIPLVGANLVGMAIQNVDYIVVGRLLGAEALGLYLLAFNISGWPMNVFGSVVRSVTLPAFARMQERGDDMTERFTDALRFVSRITFPVCLFLAALAVPLIAFVYGDKWSAAAGALVGLAIFSAYRTVLEVFSDFMVTLGRTRQLFVIQLFWLPSLVVALILLVNQAEIAGAGAAHLAVVALVVFPAYLYYLWRASVSPMVVLRTIVPCFAWAGATAGLAWFISSFISNPLVACLVGGAIAFVIYLIPYRTWVINLVSMERTRRRMASEARVSTTT